MKKSGLILIGVAATISIIIGAYYYFNRDVHYHAGFQVYVNDARVDFSDSKYMHLAPCRQGGELDLEDVANRVHLHANNGEVAHVHADKVAWGHLFASLKYPMYEPVSGYINGQPVEDILYQPIKPYDSVVLFIGNNSEIPVKLNQRVTVEAMKAAEAQIENCGT